MNEQLYLIFSESIEFCHTFENNYYTFLKAAGFKKRLRRSRMELAELLTIQIWFHFSGFKNFKKYYKDYVLKHFKYSFFLVSYAQYNKMANEIPFLLDLFLKSRLKKKDSIFFIDATSLAVCHRVRALRNQVFAKQAGFGYSTLHGKFFGFKLHLIVNHKGEIANYTISRANHHDLKYMIDLSKGLEGLLCGDKAYISDDKRQQLAKQKLKLLTKSRKNMHYQNIFHGIEKFVVEHRNLIEAVFNKLKNVFDIQTNRSRSISGFMTHCFSALLAYTFDPMKPAITIP